MNESNKTQLLILIDIDGTLKHSDGSISERAEKVIKKHKEKGNIVVLCTARPRYYTLKISKQLGIDEYLISSNGSEVSDTKQNINIWVSYINPDICKNILNDSLKINIRTLFVSNNTEYVTQFTRNNSQILIDHTNLNIVSQEKIKQIMIISDDLNKLKNFHLNILKKYKIKIVDSSLKKKKDNYFSIISKNSSKGVALLKLANYLNIPFENTIAIGNDNNDLSMIRVAGVGVSVANATSDLKKSADLIIKSNDEDGVAIYLESLL